MTINDKSQGQIHIGQIFGTHGLKFLATPLLYYVLYNSWCHYMSCTLDGVTIGVYSMVVQEIVVYCSESIVVLLLFLVTEGGFYLKNKHQILLDCYRFSDAHQWFQTKDVAFCSNFSDLMLCNRCWQHCGPLRRAIHTGVFIMIIGTQSV